MLALLALASFPAVAQADSGGAQYETAVPKATGHEETPTRSNEVTAGSSKDDGGTSGGSRSGAGDSGSDSSGGASGNKNGSTGGGDGKGQGNSGKASLSDQHATPSDDSESNETGFAPTGSQSDDDGGSSPLVPILIAIVLLAAVSVGIVYYRQRRGGAGAPASPKAG